MDSKPLADRIEEWAPSTPSLARWTALGLSWVIFMAVLPMGLWPLLLSSIPVALGIKRWRIDRALKRELAEWLELQ